MSKVGIVSCDSYELDVVKRAINIAIANSDFPEITGKKVLLKPNILSDTSPEKAITTHPMVLKAVIQIVKEKGAGTIYVGDSPALQGKKFRPTKSQLSQICEDEAVEWVDFTIDPLIKKIPIVNHKVTIARIVEDIDFSISLSKFKTHEFMYATGSVKNMFGLLPGNKKSRQHMRHPSKSSFAEMICGVLTLSKVEYTIMDAIIGMEGPGPANGIPRHVGKIIAGENPVAVDIAQATIMGYDPLKIPIIKCALDNEITEINRVEDIEYTLHNANDLIIKDFKRVGKNNSSEADDNDAEYLNRATPEFDDDKCIYCQKCINICPANALKMIDGKVAIDKDVCIRCYCCNEVCPVNAISVEQ